MTPLILDCTLRDGGYYNNWDFEREVVEKYIKAMEQTGVEYIELGLRNFNKPGFLGPFAYTTDDFINTLPLSGDSKVGVMIDAKTIISSSLPTPDAIRKLFVSKDRSKVALVRIAAHYHEIANCKAIAEELKNLGYLVGLNLMQSGGKAEAEIKSASAEISSWNSIAVLYYADSLGNMDRDEVERIYNCLRHSWDGAIGIHTHNNKGNAIENTLYANTLGVTWLDATVQGMGRGAGNAQTELLVTELNLLSEKSRPTERLYELSLNDFQKLRDTYGWGHSLLYHISASNSIHPSYAQMLLSDKKYNISEKINAILALAEIDSASYSKDLIDETINQSKNCSEEYDSIYGLFEAKNILILGAGPSLKKHSTGIEIFAKNKNCAVLSLNTHTEINKNIIDFYITSDQTRLSLEINEYSKNKKPLIAPPHLLSDELIKSLKEKKLIKYGLITSKGSKPDITSNYCRLPSKLSIGYALAIAMAGKAKQVYLAGFDGYSAEDPRQIEMAELLKSLEEITTKLNVLAVTPTSYPIAQGSVYAPF